MQKTKSLLVKVLVVLFTLCCSLGLVFGLVGCGDSKSIERTAMEDGKLVIYYTDGTHDKFDVKGDKGDPGEPGKDGLNGESAGQFDPTCDCEYVEYVAQYATCVDPEITVKACAKCDGYEINVGEKAEDYHGVWTYMDIPMDEEAYAPVLKLLVLDTTDAIEILDKEDNEFEGSCPRKKCKLCNEELEQHANKVERLVHDGEVNPCEDKHLVVVTCADCNAVIHEVKEKDATGHDYRVVDQDPQVDGVQHEDAADGVNFIVHMACDACDDEIEIPTTVKNVVSVNCKEQGYTTFEYKFNNFAFNNDETKVQTVTFDARFVPVAQPATHVAKVGDVELPIVRGSDVHYGADNTKELDALFNAKVIEWEEGAPATCSDKATAIFRCDVCDTLITFNLYNKHEYPETPTQAKSCTVDGYYKCNDCTHKDFAAELKATGHNYQYVEGSYETLANGNAQFKCSSCNDTQTVAASLVQDHPATDCKAQSHKEYKSTLVKLPAVAEGNAEGYPARQEVTVEIHFNVNYGAEKAHTVGLYEGEAVKIVKHDEVEFEPAHKALIADGKIEWEEGSPATCKVKATAIFRCTVCNTLITFQLSGEHNIEGVEPDVTAPTCLTRGYTTKNCANDGCDVDVEITSEAKDALGHTYVPDETSLSAWKALSLDERKTTAVKFVCSVATCQNSDINLVPTYERVSGPDTGCVDVEKDVFTFSKDYLAEDKYGEDMTITFTYVETFDLSDGAHTLTDGTVTITNLHPGDTKEHNPDYAALLAAGVIEWEEGKPATCSDHTTAIFRCSGCKTLITIQLSGEHDIADAELKRHEPTCEDDGYTYKVCATNPNHIVEIDPIDATGHDYEWTVTGATLTDAGTCEGVCKNSAVCDKVYATASVKDNVEVTCGRDGKVVYEYKYEGEVVATKTVYNYNRPAHETYVAGTTPTVLFEDAAGNEYLAYFCEVCKGFVVIG